MIDTAEKRKSISGIGGVTLIPGVTPNATMGVAWRQESGWSYSGLTPLPPSFHIPPLVIASPDFQQTVTAGPNFKKTNRAGPNFGSGS